MSNSLENFQNNLNKKINKFFDIKYIYDHKYDLKENIDINEIIRDYKYLKKSIVTKPKKKVILNLKNFDKKKYICRDKKFRKKIIKINELLIKEDMKQYFNFFLIHGSLATLDYVKGWSDVDTFVVLKDEILFSKIKMSKLKKFLKKLYKVFYSITKLQHHGLIIFTEFDLKNYLNSFLPIEAFENNLNLLNKKKIVFKKQTGINKKIYLDLLERKELLTRSNKIGRYMHHPRKNKYLSVPLKPKVNEMYQLFCHLGYVNTLPAYYFSAIGKSCSKKNSFKLFNKTKIGQKLNKFIKKSEFIRKNWKENKKNIFSIPNWVISKIGKDYMKESEKNFNILINEIKKKNKY